MPRLKMTMTSAFLRRNKNIIIILGILFLFIAVPRITFPDLEHGDEYADANILTSGQNFVKFGFIKCHFLSFLGQQMHHVDGAYCYTHYPPLNDIINGALRVIFRTDSLVFFRVVALFFSFLSIVFWFFFIKRLTNSYMMSWLAAVFYMTNPAFIYGMDALHQCSYAEALRSMTLYFFARACDASAQKKQLFILIVGALLFLESLLTFEYIIYFALFFILFKYFFKTGDKFPSRKVVLSFACVPAAAFALHVLQNAWYFGSFSQAFQDLRNSAIRRVAHSTDASPLTFYNWWNHVILKNFSTVFLFDYLFLFIAVFLSYLLYQRVSAGCKKRLSPILRLFIIMAVCGVSWYIVFPSHSWAHAFVGFLVRHLVPAASLGFAIFCYIIFSYIKENLSFRRYAYMSLALVIVLIAVTGVGNSQLPVSQVKIKNAREFIKFKECLYRLKQASKPADKIGVNYYRCPFIRYYADRDCVVVYDKRSLEEVSEPPQYFILLPYANRSTQVLLEYLNQNYTPLWQCNSSSFPAIIFEQKK